MSKRNATQVPNYVTLIEATYEALKELGGSGRNDEINKKVYQILSKRQSAFSASLLPGGMCRRAFAYFPIRMPY